MHRARRISAGRKRTENVGGEDVRASAAGTTDHFYLGLWRHPDGCIGDVARIVVVSSQAADLTKLRENVLQACRWSIDHHAEQRQIRQARVRWQTLGPEEVLVAHLILEGLPNKAVSARLDVSLRTVESRRQSIFQKLAVGSVCQFARTAILAGVLCRCVPPDPGTPNCDIFVETSSDSRFVAGALSAFP